MFNSLYTYQLEMYSFLQNSSSHAHRNDAKQYYEDLIEHNHQLDLKIQAQIRNLQHS